MQTFLPDALPLSDLDYRLLLPLVGQANAALARYDGLLQGIPNPAVMLSPLTTREAVLTSSRRFVLSQALLRENSETKLTGARGMTGLTIISREAAKSAGCSSRVFAPSRETTLAGHGDA